MSHSAPQPLDLEHATSTTPLELNGDAEGGERLRRGSFTRVGACCCVTVATQSCPISEVSRACVPAGNWIDSVLPVKPNLHEHGAFKRLKCAGPAGAATACADGCSLRLCGAGWLCCRSGCGRLPADPWTR